MDIFDVESAIMNGQLDKTEIDDPRGERYTVIGTAIDQRTQIGIVGRFKETGIYLIITVYRTTELKVMAMYGYPCEHCEGIVREKIVKREAFKHKNGFVILENVPIGI